MQHVPKGTQLNQALTQASYDRTLPRDMKKCSGYKSLNPNNVKIHSTEKDPRSTKSPLNSCGSLRNIWQRHLHLSRICPFALSAVYNKTWLTYLDLWECHNVCGTLFQVLNQLTDLCSTWKLVAYFMLLSVTSDYTALIGGMNWPGWMMNWKGWMMNWRMNDELGRKNNEMDRIDEFNRTNDEPRGWMTNWTGFWWTSQPNWGTIQSSVQEWGTEQNNVSR